MDDARKGAPLTPSTSRHSGRLIGMICLPADQAALTVNAVISALEALPHHALTQHLLTNPASLDKAAIADARHQAPPTVANALRSPDLLEAWTQAIARVGANLTSARRQARRANSPDLDRVRHLDRELGRILERATEARSLLRSQRTRPADADEHAANTLRGIYPEEYSDHLARALDQAHLPPARPYPLPKPLGAWTWASRLNLVAPPTAEEQHLLDLDDQTFTSVVTRDINGTRSATLRADAVLDRWASTLADVHQRDLNLPQPENDATLARRQRYRAALQDRRGEARRALLRRQDRIRAVVDELNDEPARHRARVLASNALIDAHADEYTDLLSRDTSAA